MLVAYRSDALGDDGVHCADPGTGSHLRPALVGADLEQVLELQRHQRRETCNGEARGGAALQFCAQLRQGRPSDLRPAVVVSVAQTVTADLITAVREATPSGSWAREHRRRSRVLTDADALAARVQTVTTGKVQVTQARQAPGIGASDDQTRSHLQAQPGRPVRRVRDPCLTFGAPGLAPGHIMIGAQAPGGVLPQARGDHARGRSQEVSGRRDEPLAPELWPHHTQKGSGSRISGKRDNGGHTALGAHRAPRKPTRSSSSARSSASRWP